MAIIMTKNRNILSIQDTAKTAPYTFDINTGVICGLRGKPVQQTPKAVNEYFRGHMPDNVTKTLQYLHNSWGCAYVNMAPHIELIQLADRLQNVGYIYGQRGARMVYEYDVATINQHWKAICKWIPNRRDNESISDFLQQHAKVLWYESNGIKPDGHMFTQEMADWMYDTFSSDSFYDRQKLHLIAGWLCKGLWGYEHNNHYRMQRVRELFNMAEAMETTVRKDDFFRQYAETYMTYKIWKKEHEDDDLRRHQMRHKNALTFEYGDFQVVIPTTSAEFVAEGDAQHNCVARLYLPEVKKGDTNVVFVRKKSALDQSYITCEVRNGSIWQFYLARNRPPRRAEDIEFRNAYQTHLDATWGQG